MHYADCSVCSTYIPKLLGIYERELSPCIETICADQPRLIVDVGAAEGYYAVGLAMRNPQARVIAFEIEEKGRAALLDMARKNSVADRIEVRGKCEPPDLQAALSNQSSPVVICDVEGYELTLLNPETVPGLRQAAMLVELHDFMVPGTTETLLRRFNKTHSIMHIKEVGRSRAEFPWRTFRIMFFPHSSLERAVSELRDAKMSWLWMNPKLKAQ
jgi:precorrin-6B methylase 2